MEMVVVPVVVKWVGY